MQRWQEAVAEYEEAIRLAPGFAVAHGNRAGALSHLGRLVEALAAADEATRLAPENAWMHARRAQVLRCIGHFREALGACDEAARLDPQFARASACRAGALRELGHLQEAASIYADAIQLAPEDAWLHGKLGECLLLQGQQSTAAVSLRKAAELEPDDAFEARVLLAALTWPQNQAQAAQLATTALGYPGASLLRFRHAELRAIAHLVSGDPESATTELMTAGPAYTAGDLFQQPLYDLFEDPPVPGLGRILAIWDQIAVGANDGKTPG